MLKTIEIKLKKELLKKTEWDKIKFDLIYSIIYIPKKKYNNNKKISKYIKYIYNNDY